MDGDRFLNFADVDVDGDGQDNYEDADMDGDGADNAEDGDEDGDGIPDRVDKRGQRCQVIVDFTYVQNVDLVF